MNRVLSKLWLWFWYLLPANPILVRVVCGASKRTRHLWLRCGYLAALLGVVFISLFVAISGRDPSLSELAKGASQTFMLASMVQLALMCFLAPIFTASAITQERDAQTFNILLSTPMSSAQIVFGSLMSRLYFVLMLLLAGLPIFLMTMVYGGVTASQVIESFALAGSTAVLTGALAIFIAMMGVGTRRTIFSFYLLIALYLLTLYLLGHNWSRTWISESPPNIDDRRMSWLTPFHPFLALDVALNKVYAPPYARLGEYSRWSRYALAFPSAAYVIWTLALALLLTVTSIWFVRRGAKTGEPGPFSALLDRFRKQPAGERTRPPRSVWNNPVAWREARTHAFGGGLLRWTIIIGGFAGPLALYFLHRRGAWPGGVIPLWLASLLIIQFGLALIIATNTSATAITKEKESRTMDLLLTTPLTSRYILWGKLRGLVSFALPLLTGPIAVLLLFAASGSRGRPRAVMWIEAVFELGALLVIYTAFACVVGLWKSLSSKTNMGAVMHSLGMVIAVYGAASVIGFAVVHPGSGEFGAFLAPFTPFTSIWYLVDPMALYNSATEFADGAARARTALAVGSVVATLLYAMIVWRLYAALVRNFDMTLRKQSAT